MIDTHCHILPGVDDGARTLDDSIAMAQAAVANGITHLLCTPHHNNGEYFNVKSKVIEKVQFLQKELDNRQIPLHLFESQEIRITGELLTDFQKGEILGTDTGDRYLLIEFPSQEVVSYAERIFFELMKQGITPIIVHPERNAKFIEDPNELLKFLDMGVLAQLTAPSYLGVFGTKIQKTAKIMLTHNMVQLMATDAHNLKGRKFCLKEAYELMEKEFGRGKVDEFQQTAKDIVNGDLVFPEGYSEFKKKKFGFF